MRVDVISIIGVLIDTSLDFRHIIVGVIDLWHGVELALLLALIHVTDDSLHYCPSGFIQQLCFCH